MGSRVARPAAVISSIAIIAFGLFVMPTLAVLLLLVMLFGWAIGRGIAAGRRP